MVGLVFGPGKGTGETQETSPERVLLRAGSTEEDDHCFATPEKDLELTDVHQRFARSFSLSDNETPEHSSQISPASVLPTDRHSPLKARKQLYSTVAVTCLTVGALTACQSSTHPRIR